jgi:transcriptional regulator with XRE-family HTH domain
MAHAYSTINLEATRQSIVRKLREIRRERGWTQAELAEMLGLSQARISVIERGGGTISAEQFVALLALANVPIEDFLPRQNPEDEVQNTLARLGALHLREIEDVVPTERFRKVEDAVAETLVAPRSSRLVLALAPVLVWNIDHVNLDQTNARLERIGLSHRLGWLVESILHGIPLVGNAGAPAWARRRRRAAFVLTEFLNRFQRLGPNTEQSPEAPVDHLDSNIRSAKTLAMVWQSSGDVARRWGIATELAPEDFGAALRVVGVDR